MDAQPNLKRIAFIVLAAMLLIILVPWLWRSYHTGTVIITTNSRYNTITLTKINAEKGDTKKIKGQGKLSKTVPSGEYAVSVSGNSVATTQTINLKPRQTLRSTINPINTTGVEPVIYKNAVSLAASNSQLVYLASPSNWLYRIDSQNNLTKIDGGHAFQVVKWAGPSFGVGQGSDGHLYTIVDGTVSLLKVPFSYGGAAISFDVSPSKTIYISQGADVYAGNQNGNFKKIYTAISANPTLAAGPNQVAVSDTKYGDKSSNIPKPLLATINTNGKQSKKNIEAEQLTWSPNGQYLVTVNQANPIIYDVALHTVATVPTSSVVGQFTWLNGNTLLYTMNSQLWTYNLPSKKAQLLANMPSDNSITGLYLSDDKSYVYVSTIGSNAYAIRRIGLKNQRVPDYVYNLQDILPEGTSEYVMGLVNFSLPPTILVQAYPKAPPKNYIQQAQAQLQSQGFDISQLRFQQGKPVFSD